MGMDWIFSRLILTALILGLLCSAAAGAGTEYRVFSRSGYVAVCRRDTGEVALTDSRISMLPYSDRQLLHRGIFCGDTESLLLLLENFCS